MHKERLRKIIIEWYDDGLEECWTAHSPEIEGSYVFDNTEMDVLRKFLNEENKRLTNK